MLLHTEIHTDPKTSSMERRAARSLDSELAPDGLRGDGRGPDQGRPRDTWRFPKRGSKVVETR